ncbi:hypothetical protein BOX30_04205 [Leptospirillum ferriphilum]|nr:hypothetical protein BOX30_04205 [Leptospirillum ferriphilum]
MAQKTPISSHFSRIDEATGSRSGGKKQKRKNCRISSFVVGFFVRVSFHTNPIFAVRQPGFRFQVVSV